MEDNTELIDFREMDWYKEIRKEMTPAKNLKFYRRLLKMSQAELASKLKIPKQTVSDLENGKTAISKAMAAELSKLFEVNESKFN